jgi:hypothetical protein
MTSLHEVDLTGSVTKGGTKTSLRNDERMRRECGVMNIPPWKLFVVILLALFFCNWRSVLVEVAPALCGSILDGYEEDICRPSAFSCMIG